MTIPSLLLATLPALAPAPDELLPATPDGWRYEKLDLPLSFAPDLPYAGFEELRFAPGMFDADAPDYWSYALALRTDTAVDFDAARVEEFLVQYYAGLCAAVAEGRGLEFERDSLEVALEDHGAQYVATIGMIDAFVTGGPLELRLELTVHPGPTSTELFGVASPADTDAAIWKELHAIRRRWRAEREPAVLLNHLFVAPDSETYAALRDAELFQDAFAVRELRTTVRADLTYTGLYLYGRDTYFEFLEPGSASGIDVGSYGIAFGLEVPGATAGLKGRLTSAGIECFDGPRSRELDGEAVPWFRIMGLAGAHARSRMNLFTMEYDPRFLGGWHPGLAPTYPGISRRQVLERYAAQLGQEETRASGLVQNVSEVQLELDEAERQRFLASCGLFGYAVSEASDEWTCRGPQVTFVVRPSDEPGRITGFRLALRRAVEARTLQLGKARVELRGDVATFTFQR